MEHSGTLILTKHSCNVIPVSNISNLSSDYHRIVRTTYINNYNLMIIVGSDLLEVNLTPSLIIYVMHLH